MMKRQRTNVLTLGDVVMARVIPAGSPVQVIIKEFIRGGEVIRMKAYNDSEVIRMKAYSDSSYPGIENEWYGDFSWIV